MKISRVEKGKVLLYKSLKKLKEKSLKVHKNCKFKDANFWGYSVKIYRQKFP